MALNRLVSDITKISDIMGYNLNLLDMSSFGIETYIDRKGDSDKTFPLEVIYDKQKDIEYLDVEARLTKIYNAFMYGEHSDFWKPLILEKFETETQVDFMLLTSFIYMRTNADNKETRVAESMATIAAILAKFIK